MQPGRVAIVVVFLFCTATARAAPPAAQADDGYVDLPLPTWLKLIAAPEIHVAAPRPPEEIVYLDRRLEGSFRRGVLSATLVTRVEVLAADGHVRVPIIDSGATLGSVLVDGKPAAVIDADDMYTIGVDRPGVYRVEIAFHSGEEVERFTREIGLALPAGGTTRVALTLPETQVEPRLGHGAITAVTARPGATLVEGVLDASGELALTWTRRADDGPASAAARLRAHARALFTIGDGLVDGSLVLDLEVASGETDQLALRLPPDVEVTEVSGDAVLQWRADGGALTVLFKYLVADKTRLTVRFQYATEEDKVALRLPLPAPEVALTGHAGVRVPAGLDVKVSAASGAEALDLRDLPAELTAMSATPLRYGFAFSGPPRVELAVARLDTVELTTTLIDEEEAVTVLLDDGTEITKLRLHLRNNARQYLRLVLPAGATLTNALLDGTPVRPALDGDAALLFSLRQSERVDPAVGRTHVVRRGETLGDIAHLYYSDPDKWTVILEANRKLLSEPSDLQPGQTLVIPAAGDVTGTVSIEESSFVLELAYQRPGAALGSVGVAELRLPALDVPALGVSWHLYAPDGVTPIYFAANLAQLTQLRYGTFRRLERFLDDALGGRKAWAGGEPEGEKQAAYKSLLEQRRDIYRDEAIEHGGGEVGPSAFPLVGQVYRFKRILADGQPPRIAFLYARAGVLTAVRWAALLCALAVTLIFFGPRVGPRRRAWRWALALVAGAVLLVVGHHVMGVHRRLVWGIDLALLVALYRSGALARLGTRLADLLGAPWRLRELVTFSTLFLAAALVGCAHVAVHYPLLLSLVVLVVLARLHQRGARGEA